MAIPTLLTVKQFTDKHPAFPEGGLRHHIFHENENGFHKCVRRVGRRVLIDEQAFFEWIERQQADAIEQVRFLFGNRIAGIAAAYLHDVVEDTPVSKEVRA